jgi:peptidoglycan-associated lipoprotein
MHRVTRALALSAVATVALAGCKRKPAETAPAPVQTVSNNPAPTPPPPACDAACEEAKRRAAEEERRRAMEAARGSLTATIYFDYDRSEITDDARAKLDAKVPVLTQNTSIRIRIAGHTDSRGSDEYNLALGQRRAAAAKQYLTDRGIDAGRIEIVSFGEERPACTTEDESCWGRNRRDEFEITVGEITAVQTANSVR